VKVLKVKINALTVSCGESFISDKSRTEVTKSLGGFLFVDVDFFALPLVLPAPLDFVLLLIVLDDVDAGLFAFLVCGGVNNDDIEGDADFGLDAAVADDWFW
jgi:hypothetical protein